MQSLQPDTTDAGPLRRSPRSIGILVIRFVGLLLAAVVVLALAWSR